MAAGSGLISQGIMIKFGADLTGLSSGAGQAKSMLNDFSSAAKGGLKDVEGASGAASGALGGVVASVVALSAAAVGFGVKATLMAADYERSMNKVQALTGASTDQMKQFDSGLKQLAMDTGVAPKALSEGLYNVMSAGYKGADAMTVLSLATRDSVIGMTSAKVTTDALTNVMASFNFGAKDATRVNGEMLETVTLGKSTFEQYASSIVKAAGSASQFHESMETMNAAFATMTSSGIRAGQASTDFQASLKLMDGNIGVVSASLHKNGIAFDDAKFNAMDYGHKVVYLNAALDEANTKHVHITGATVTATQAIHAIATHIDVYNADLATLSDRQAMAAKTQEAWSVTQQGFTVSMERLKATASVVMIDIGQKLLPIATAGVNLLNDAFQGLMDMAGKVSDSFNAFGASLDKVGIRKLAADYSYFTAQVGYLFQIIQGIGMSIFAQFNTHLVDTHTLVGFVSTVMQDLGNVFRLAGETVRGFAKYLEGTNIPSSVMDGYNKFKTLLEDTAKVIGYVLYEAFEKAKNVYQEFLDILKLPIVQLFIEDIRKLGIAVGNTFGIIKDTGIKVFNQFKTVFDDSKKAADDFNTALSKITGISSLPGKQIEDIKNKLKGGMKLDFGVTANPHPNFLDLPQNAKNIKPPEAGKSAGGSGAFAGASQLLPVMDMISKATKAFQDFGNSLSHIDMTPFAGGLLLLKNAVGNILSLQWDQIKTVFKDLGQDAKQLGGWFKNDVAPAIKDALPGFANLGMTILTDVIPTFIKIRGVVIDVVQHAFEKFAPIIERIVPPLIRFAGVLADNIANGLKFIMPYVLQAAQAIGKFANELIDRIAPIVSKTMDGISFAVALVMNYWNMVWPMMSGVLKGVWDGIVGIIQIAWAIITGLIKVTLDIISGNWGQAWTDMQDMFKGVWDGIKTFLQGAWEIITTLLSNAWKNIQEIFAPIGSWFHDQWQKVSDAFNSVLGGIGSVATNVWNSITSGVKSAFNGIIDLVDGVIGHINDINVGGVGIHIALIPHLASGIENFIGGTALVGEKGPELVNLPKGASVLNALGTSNLLNNFKSSTQLNSMKNTSSAPSNFNYPAMTANNSGGSQPQIIVHVHVPQNDTYIDGKKLTDALGPHIANKIRLTGLRSK
jgi:phage tail tape measure protein, TP901 family, core region